LRICAHARTSLVRRSVARAWTGTPICNGNVETWRQLLSRDSILLWLLKTFRSNRRRYRALLADKSAWPGLRFAGLRHPRQADALISAWRK